MILCIDASNIRSGGGITHLVELLRAGTPAKHGFERVVVWASQATLRRLEDRPWLDKRTAPVLESHYLRRAWWQRNQLGALAAAEGCSVLFVPGGSFATGFRPVVTMSRNLLPFEWEESSRYGFSSLTLKFLMLRWTQSKSFRNASGVIFLNEYAKRAVARVTGALKADTQIVPHGIDDRFFSLPRPQRSLRECDDTRPFKLMYVSIVDVYKHQWNVAEAVARLRSDGYPIVLELIGPAYPPALKRLHETLHRVDPTGSFVRHLGPMPHNELHAHYAGADVCVFASSCENMPNILLEGMASGLPIACSAKGPMPEVLGEAGIYFDPTNPTSITDALRTLIDNPELREQKALAAYEQARQYSWPRCADETFEFLFKVAAEHLR